MTDPYVYHNLRHFVNRGPEISRFEQLISANQHRILLVRGPMGVGKSGLLHYLIHKRSDRSMVQAFVDFRLKPETGELPEALIYQLGEQLGDLFLDLLDAIDFEMPIAQARLNQEDLSQIDTGVLSEDFAEAEKGISQAILSGIASARGVPGSRTNLVDTGGGAYIEGDIDTDGGDFIGRDDIDINIDIDIAEAFFRVPPGPHPDPGAGQQKLAKKRARRQNRLFYSALNKLLTAKRVILYFDHCEEAEDAVCKWLSQELLGSYLNPTQDTSGFRIVLVGRRVPWQEQAEKRNAIVSDQELRGLELGHVEQYWVRKRGLKIEEVAEVMQTSDGIPSRMLQEAEKRLRQSGDE